MPNLITRTEWKFDVAKLAVAYHLLHRDIGWSDNNQLALTCADYELSYERAETKAHGDATQQGTVNGEVVFDDPEFDQFIPEFKYTPFYDVWSVMTDVLGVVFRMRLMMLPFKGCLSFHFDRYVRYHIPLVTNDRAFFFMNESGQFPVPRDDIRCGAMATYHLPADGSVYRADTREYHTVFNGGRQERVHLVWSAHS